MSEGAKEGPVNHDARSRLISSGGRRQIYFKTTATRGTRARDVRAARFETNPSRAMTSGGEVRRAVRRGYCVITLITLALTVELRSVTIGFSETMLGLPSFSRGQRENICGKNDVLREVVSTKHAYTCQSTLTPRVCCCGCTLCLRD